MDAISNAELLELFFTAQEFLEAQFQYWMSISFAVIVAVSVVGDRITTAVRYTLSLLYLLSTALFLLRYASAIGELTLIADAATARGIVGDMGRSLRWPIASIRTVLFLGGTVATLWFLFQKGEGILGGRT